MEDRKVLLKNGQVYINDQPVEEPYIYNDAPTYGNTYLVECQKYIIPKGKVMVFGDNRNDSYDSHFWGPLDIASIKGRAFAIYWPPKDFGMLK